MPGPARGAWGHSPVRWLNRHALVTLPERVEESNARPVREQLLSIVDSDVLVLILDMTATTACDHAGGVALARVYQRAVASGTALRLVVTDEGVRRVLAVSGVGRLVPVYDTVAAALATTRPGDNIAAAASGPEPAPQADEDVGTEVALLDRNGRIVSVNQAWRAFAAANGGDPARTGPGVALVRDLAERLTGVARGLEESAGQACASMAGQLRGALGELDAVIRDARTAIAPRGPGPDG
jgi:anti-sigma B factor antagonist